MRSPILFTLLFSTALTLAVVHVNALSFHLYWIFPWLDLLAHALGGAVLGFVFLLVPEFIDKIPKRYICLPGLIALVIIVGLLWEIYEITIGLPFYYEFNFYVHDLIVDLIMGVIGGVVGYFVGVRLRTL